MGVPIAIDRPEILWRASGLGRAGLVAQLTAPRLASRLGGSGIEMPLGKETSSSIACSASIERSRRAASSSHQWNGEFGHFCSCAPSIHSTRAGARILEQPLTPPVTWALGT